MISGVRAVSESLVLDCGPTATGGYVHGLCYHQKPSGSPGFLLPLTIKSKKASLVVILITVVALLRKTDMEPYLLPTFPKSNSLSRKPSKRTLFLLISFFFLLIYLTSHSLHTHPWSLPPAILILFLSSSALSKWGAPGYPST